LNNVKPFQNDFEFNNLCDSVGRVAPKYNILLLLGVFTGLRVSDLLLLQVKHILTADFCIIEKKTKKKRCFVLPDDLHITLLDYVDALRLVKSDYLIFSTNNNKGAPLSRVQAYRVLKKASLKNDMENIGTHSMRKTFAKKHYEEHRDIKQLQKELNHKYITTTLMYLFDVSTIADVPTFVTPPTTQQGAPRNVLTIKFDITPIKNLWAFIRRFWH